MAIRTKFLKELGNACILVQTTLLNRHVLFLYITGFADASVAPIDFPIAPAAAMPKVNGISTLNIA